MKKCDIIIFSTSASKKLITVKNVKEAIKYRKKPLLIIDLSVPTNVPKNVGLINNVSLINIDGLKDEVNKNYIKRKNEIQNANTLIIKLVDEFTIWVNNKKIRSTISQFKTNFDQIISKVKNNENQNILEIYKRSIINNIKNIELNNDQDTITIINNILLKK